MRDISITFEVSRLPKPVISFSELRLANKFVEYLGACVSPTKIIFLMPSAFIALPSVRFHGDLFGVSICPDPITKMPESISNAHGTSPQVSVPAFKISAFKFSVLTASEFACLVDEAVVFFFLLSVDDCLVSRFFDFCSSVGDCSVFCLPFFCSLVASFLLTIFVSLFGTTVIAGASWIMVPA